MNENSGEGRMQEMKAKISKIKQQIAKMHQREGIMRNIIEKDKLREATAAREKKKLKERRRQSTLKISA